MTGDIYAVSHSIAGERQYLGQTVLTYKIAYPQFVTFSAMASLRRINAHYKQQARELAAYVQERLFLDAVGDCISRQDQAAPCLAYEFQRPFEMTYGERCAISLYMDEYTYTGGAHGNTLRQSDTWNARTAERMPLSALFRPGVNYQDRILAVVIPEAQRRAEENPTAFFPDVGSLVAQNFDEENFYLTPAGIVIYYQQYAIAPYSSGIQTFEVPYGLVGARVIC